MPSEITRHSAVVRITLLADGQSFEIAELGPASITVRDPRPLLPCDAQILLDIDGQIDRWAIRLPVGIDPDHSATRIDFPSVASRTA